MGAKIPYLLNAQHARALRELDAAFERARRGMPDHPCRRGCDHCCRGPFDVGAAELWQIVEALTHLDGPARVSTLKAIKRTASEERAALGVDADDLAVSVEALGEGRFDAMCDEREHAPCPLLSADGSCTVYAARPEICRLRGGRYTTSDGVVELGCPEGWTSDLEPVEGDLDGVYTRLADLERRAEVPGLVGARTTLAMGIDLILRRLR